jgi:hypothetical protein
MVSSHFSKEEPIMSSSFEGFLLELARVLYFPTLAPDEQGACLVIIKEGNIPLLFEFDDQLEPNTILLSSPIAAIPPRHRSDIYEALLRGNMVAEDTLSAKPDEELVFLHRRFHPNIQAKEIDFLLQIFLQTVKEWKIKVEAIASQPPKLNQIPSKPTLIKVFPFKA